MLTELCQTLRNWFEVDKVHGTYTIRGGTLAAPFLQNGQYFRIVGSVFNDGVYQYPAVELHDETFDGSIWALAIPREVVWLARDIEVWRQKYEAADSPAMSPYTSESFAGYSYSKGSGSSSSTNSVGVNWQTVFRSRLRQWRKL